MLSSVWQLYYNCLFWRLRSVSTLAQTRLKALPIEQPLSQIENLIKYIFTIWSSILCYRLCPSGHEIFQSQFLKNLISLILLLGSDSFTTTCGWYDPPPLPEVLGECAWQDDLTLNAQWPWAPGISLNLQSYNGNSNVSKCMNIS